MATHFVCTLCETQVQPLKTLLDESGFSFSSGPHTHFIAKKPGICLSCFRSGKISIQGKGADEFIRFTLEPFLGDFSYSLKQDTPLSKETIKPHIGTDEAGKGDFFGPLVVAGVYVDERSAEALYKIGIKDSKTLTDTKIASLVPQIVQLCPNYIIRLMPEKYNQLYEQFGNLNHLLAWCHATVIDQLVSATRCPDVLVDKFAHESLIERQLRKKGTQCLVVQRTKAESDLAVAAASCLARSGFVQGLDILSKKIGFTLPKGSSSPAVLKTAQKIVSDFDKDSLFTYTKVHFKITAMV